MPLCANRQKEATKGGETPYSWDCCGSSNKGKGKT